MIKYAGLSCDCCLSDSFFSWWIEHFWENGNLRNYLLRFKSKFSHFFFRPFIFKIVDYWGKVFICFRSSPYFESHLLYFSITCSCDIVFPDLDWSIPLSIDSSILAIFSRTAGLSLFRIIWTNSSFFAWIFIASFFQEYGNFFFTILLFLSHKNCQWNLFGNIFNFLMLNSADVIV